MEWPNIYTGTYEYDEDDPPGFRGAAMRLSPRGGELAVKAFELPVGERLCPYHYEYVEEWLLLISGELLMRTPGGESALEPGAAVRFPLGPDGAHAVTATGVEAARFVMFSSARTPAICVYPDSDKVAAWGGGEADDYMFRRADGSVPYYDGET